MLTLTFVCRVRVVLGCRYQPNRPAMSTLMFSPTRRSAEVTISSLFGSGVGGAGGSGGFRLPSPWSMQFGSYPQIKRVKDPVTPSGDKVITPINNLQKQGTGTVVE